jgi:hypothetical protein
MKNSASIIDNYKNISLLTLPFSASAKYLKGSFGGSLSLIKLGTTSNCELRYVLKKERRRGRRFPPPPAPGDNPMTNNDG